MMWLMELWKKQGPIAPHAVGEGDAFKARLLKAFRDFSVPALPLSEVSGLAIASS